MGKKKSYSEIVIHGNNKWHDVMTESSHDHPIQNEDVRPNLCRSNDDVTAWGHCNLSDM